MSNKEVELKRGDKVSVISDDGSTRIGYIYEKATNSNYYYVKRGKQWMYIHEGYLTKIE